MNFPGILLQYFLCEAYEASEARHTDLKLLEMSNFNFYKKKLIFMIFVSFVSLLIIQMLFIAYLNAHAN